MNSQIGKPTSPEVIRVLLIDDHKTLLWGLEQLIDSEQTRMEVVGKATSAGEALAMLDTIEPDIVLLDLDLGDENGVTAIPQVLAKSSAKVLVLTGVRDPNAHHAAMLAGARGVIGKEAVPSDILEAIAQVHRGELWLNRVASHRLLSELLLQPPKSGEPVSAPDPLTLRERQIVLALTEKPESPLKTIAVTLMINEQTLRNHLTSIYNKLGLSGRLQLYIYATKNQLTE